MELPGRNFQTSARHPFCPVTSSGKLLYLCFSSNVCLHSLFGSYNVCMCTYSVWFTGTPFSGGALNCRRWEGRTQILSVWQPRFSSYFWWINLVQIWCEIYFILREVGLADRGFQRGTINSTPEKWTLVLAPLKDFVGFDLFLAMKFCLLTGSQPGCLTWCLLNGGRIVTEMHFFQAQANIPLKGYNPSSLNSFPSLIVAPLGPSWKWV